MTYDLGCFHNSIQVSTIDNWSIDSLGIKEIYMMVNDGEQMHDGIFGHKAKSHIIPDGAGK